MFASWVGSGVRTSRVESGWSSTVLLARLLGTECSSAHAFALAVGSRSCHLGLQAVLPEWESHRASYTRAPLIRLKFSAPFASAVPFVLPLKL